MRGTDAERYGGQVRTEQNWIGGSSYNPCSASFVPPPPEMVEGLLQDLCTSCNDDSLPTVAQAAIAHAQFETIHPFIEGNGRTVRALIHMVMRRRGLAPRVLPPVSLVLATFAQDYIDALGGYRYTGEPDSEEAYKGADRWIALFAGACIRAVQDAGTYEARIRELEASWRERLGSVRAGSSVDLLLKALPGAPLLTIKSAGELIGRSFRAVNPAVARLEEAGIVSQM
jgi:Fic family protein